MNGWLLADFIIILLSALSILINVFILLFWGWESWQEHRQIKGRKE